MSLQREITSCFRRLLTISNRRGFRFSAANFSSEKKLGPAHVIPKSATVTQTEKVEDGGSTQSETADPVRLLAHQRRAPTTLDRYFLVWSGQFKSKDEIPAKLEPYQILKAREWGRVRFNIYILFVAAGLCVAAVYAGKQAAKRGESVEADNLAWHKKIKEDYLKEQEAKAKGL